MSPTSGLSLRACGPRLIGDVATGRFASGPRHFRLRERDEVVVGEKEPESIKLVFEIDLSADDVDVDAVRAKLSALQRSSTR